MTAPDSPAEAAVPAGAPSPAARRRWPWPVVAAVVVLVGGASVAARTLAPAHAHPAHRVTAGPDLRGATLDLPQWPAPASGCATTRAAFHDGAFVGPAWTTRINDTAEVDIDNDGNRETAGLFWCTNDRDTRLPRMYFRQVAVFHRGADGLVLTVGQVARQGVLGGDIDAVRPGPGGTVEVHQADFPSCKNCYNPAQQWQWRGYGWDGHAFRQTSGPTSFARNPLVTDLALDYRPLRTRRVGGAIRTAVLSLTARNNGPVTARVAVVHVEVDGWTVTASPTGCTQAEATASYHTEIDCALGRFPAGAARALRITLATPLDDAAIKDTFVQAEAISYPEGVEGLRLPDRAPADNVAVIPAGMS